MLIKKRKGERERTKWNKERKYQGKEEEIGIFGKFYAIWDMGKLNWIIASDCNMKQPTTNVKFHSYLRIF